MSREQLKDAWLRLPIGFKDKNIFNPLEHIPPEFEENPHLYILFLLQRPEYLSFAAREILNVKLLPIQNLILQQMWTHKFPMLIASRGFGKCEKDSYVESQSGFHKIDELCDGLSEMEKRYTPTLTLKGMNGYKEVEYVWRNKKDKVYIIETCSGFRKICSPTHPIKIVRGREIDWEHAQKIKVGDYIPIVRDDSWFPNPNTSITEEFGLMMGQLFGLGSFEGDKFCIRMPGKYKESLNKLTLKYLNGTARIARLKKKRLGKDTYWYNDKFLKQFLKYTSKKMDFPKVLLSSSKPVMTAFISGLFSHKMKLDRKARKISLFCQNEDFARTLQFIFTKYGIIAHILKKKYNGKMYYLLSIYGEDTLRFNEKFSIFRKCKKRILESYKSWPKFSRDIIPNSLYNTSVKREGRRIHFTYNNIPYDCDNRELIERHYYYDKVKAITESEDDTYDVYIPGDHTFYASGFISHNSFMMGVYCLLRMLLLPGRSIVVAGSAFRQSKIIFGYMENIWRNAPLLRDLFSNENFNGPRREPDMYRFHLGDSITRAIPVGDGCLTGNTLITYKDKFSCINDGANDFINLRDRYVWGNQQWQLSDEIYNNNVKDTKVITTDRGYKIEGTYNHKIKILNKNEIKWKRFDELNVDDIILVDKTKRWHDGKIDETTDECYALGLMIGDGSYTTKYRLGFTTKDEELARAIQVVGNFKKSTDNVHYTMNGIKNVNNWLNKWGITQTHTKDKIIPDKMLCAEQEKMSAFISGLFDTDGTVQAVYNRGYSVKVSFTNTSEKLCRQLQYILLHYGIVSTLKYRDRNDKWNRIWELYISGKNVVTFYDKIGFRLKRKNNIIKDILSRKKRFATQEKTLNENPNIILDKITSIENSSSNTYDIHVPKDHEYCANGFLSHNTTIRGLRANDIIVDEFASLSRDVFEVVIQGFAAVRSDPFSGVEYEAMKEYAQRMNIQLSEDEQRMDQNNENQIVISGTAYYDFNHFAEYHKKYHKIICCKGDLSRVSDSLEEYEKNESLDWRQRCIIRIPYELIPKGFMDDGIVMAAKATSHIGLFDMEYRATFSKDSHGFFKRSLIESCVVSPSNPIILPSGPVDFTARMFGDGHKKYVFGVDVASEIDRFAINILEIHDDHRRIVYGWSTNRKEFNQKVKTGLIKDTDYYGHCARKIRDLMKVFPCVRIMMDSQGGGIGVMEALHDVEKLEVGEDLIWPVIDPYKPADTDGKAGKHILEMVNFANAEWTSEANHGMKKDLEDKALIFPYFDPVSIELATIEDGKSGKLYDTFEDCLMEIEELKNELSTIVISQTSNGRDRWDTPEIKLPGNKKGRLRKDRYSALLMANMGARTLLRNPHQKLVSGDGGGFSKSGKVKDGRKYTGPEWLTRSLEDLYE